MYVKSILNIRNTFIVFLIITILCSVASVSAANPQINNETFANATLDNITTVHVYEITPQQLDIVKYNVTVTITNATWEKVLDAVEAGNRNVTVTIANATFNNVTREEALQQAEDLKNEVMTDIGIKTANVIIYIAGATTPLPVSSFKAWRDLLNAPRLNQTTDEEDPLYEKYGIVNPTPGDDGASFEVAFINNWCKNHKDGYEKGLRVIKAMMYDAAKIIIFYEVDKIKIDKTKVDKVQVDKIQANKIKNSYSTPTKPITPVKQTTPKVEKILPHLNAQNLPRQKLFP